MRRRWALAAGIVVGLTVLAVLGGLSTRAAEGKKTLPDFEVWAIDQADTSPAGGGLLYIWDGDDISRNPSKARARVIDLAQAATKAGCPVARRPHMMLVNHTSPPSHVIISNVGSGHIFFVDVDSKEIVGCVSGAGNAHAAVATPDNSMVIVDDQNGQNLRKVHTDYASNSYTLVETLSLAPFAAALGTATARPICHDYTADGRFAYVTMGQGGLLVVDVGSADGSTPMSVVHVYPASTVPGMGCGAFRLPDSRMLTNGESGAAGGDDFLYIFDTSGAAEGVFPDPAQIELPGEDTHGVALCQDKRGNLFALTAMRVSNEINSVDLQAQEVVSTRPLARPWSTDPKPDLADIVGNRMFITLRGPKPLTAIPTLENAARTPGVAVLKVHTNCNTFDWDPRDIAPMFNPNTTTLADGTVVTSVDPHGLEVVLR